MSGHHHYQHQGYYNAPVPTHAHESSMLFIAAPNESFDTPMDQHQHSQQQHSQQSWNGEGVLLGELDLDVDVGNLYPPFLRDNQSPSQTFSPAAHQQTAYANLSPNHLSPTDIPAIHTGNLHAYSPAASGHGVGPSPPSFYSSPSMTTPSPTSPYPSSPELLRTPITPYSAPRNDMVGIHASSASPASSIDPPHIWPLQSKAFRSRSHSDSRLPMSNPAGRGPMVPQRRYRPHTTSDRRRYVEEVELEPAILFSTLRPEMEGFPLADAVSGKFANLAQRDDQMFNERGPSISVRINWPGYNPWSRQIPTRDFRNPPGPITRSKLAKNVAKSVQRFIIEQANKPMDEDADPAWQVGKGGVLLGHLALVRLDHVSKGSWQAQLCLVDPTAQL